MSKNTRNRILLTAVAALLLVAVTVGGTMAWLADDTDPVINEFTPTNISVDLTESKDEDTTKENHQFQMVPGAVIEKDPKVTVTNNDFDAYLFVKITESTNLEDYIEYVIADGWTAIDGTDTVIWREVKKGDSVKTFSIIATENTDGTKTNDTVKVLTTLKNTDMDTAKTNVPTLTFQAYVIQSENLTTSDMAAIYALAQADAN